MKPWRWVLLLLVVAALAAFGWHWVAADPGYLLIRLRGWRIESSVVTAVVALLLLWALLGVAWRLLRWPFGAMARRNRRVGRARLSQGLVALYEGRHGEAERALNRAARHDPQRALALLASADAARRRGDIDRALNQLDEAAELAPQAARVLRARTLRQGGRAIDAMQLLAPEADARKLPPAGWREYAEAALAAGQPQRASAVLDVLRKSGVLDGAAYAALEHRALAATLAAAADADSLNAIWRGLGRSQRADPELVSIYARQAAHHGAALAAMDEIESALRRQWDARLVDAYVDLAGDHPEQRLRQAETWLANHGDDPRLLAALGRLCARQGLWGKARGYLDRALALQPDLDGAWQSLGDVASGEGNAARAVECYRRELDRDAAALASPRLTASTAAAIVDERNGHGFPRLPAASLDVDDEGA